MHKPGSVVNISDKQYLLNKNYEKGALLTIINKLQTDLSQIKYLTHEDEMSDPGQIISDSEIHRLSPNLSLVTASSSMHTSRSHDLKARLKKNYEEKVQNLIELYENKLQEYKEKIKYLREDRESFVEALQSKQSIITVQKEELQDLELSNKELIEKHREDVLRLQEKHTQETSKLKQELDLSKNCCNDLDQVRKYLEKNNQMMKSKITDTQNECKRKLEKIADEYENEKHKYKAEIHQIEDAISSIEKQAEDKITELETSIAVAEKTYDKVTDSLKQEIGQLRQKLKEVEEQKQKMEVEKRSYEGTIANTNKYYETKLQTLNLSAKKDHEQYLDEIEAVKERFEKQFAKLEEEYVCLERDVEMKKKEFLECEAVKKQMAHEIIDLKSELEATARKHLEDFDLLKQNYEMAKHSHEIENENLKALLLDQEKLADDLDIANKKYEKQYNSLKATIKTMKEEADQDSSQMMEKLKSEKIFYQEEICKLKEECNARVRKHEEEIYRVKHENSNLLDEIDKLESSKRALEKMNRELRLGLDSAFDEYKEDIERIRRETDSKYDEFESRIDGLNSEITRQQKNIIQLEELNKMLQSTNEEYKLVNAESASKYTADITRLRDELQMTRRFHLDDMSSIQKQLDLKEQVEKEKDERIMKLKQQITEIKTSQTLGYDEKVERLEKIKNELETENNILKKRMNDFVDDFQHQKEQHDAAQERLKKRYEDENNYLKEENSKLLSSIDSLEKTVSDQEKENKLLQKNLESFSKQQNDESVELVENLTMTRAKYEEKIQKLKQELESNRRAYEIDLEVARNEFHENRKQYEEKIQELKIECNSRRLVHEELEATKHELEENYRLLQSEEFKKLALLGTMGKMKFTEH